MSEQRKAIIISTGMDNLELISKLRQNESLTAESLNRIKGLYAKLAAEKATIESAENDASLARLAKNVAAKEAISKAWMEKQAVMSAIAGGSGGAGSGFLTAEQKAHGTVENVAAGAAGGAAGHAAAGALDSVARRELLVMTRELSSGNYKRFFSSFSIFIENTGKAALEMGKLTAGILSYVAASWYFFKAVKTYSESKDAAQQAKFSGFDLNQQTASAAADASGRIDDLEKSGSLSKNQASRLRDMTDGSKNSDTVRAAQRFLLKVQTEETEKKAAAEAKAADAVRGAAVAAEDKAYSEKVAAEELHKQEEMQKRLTSLYKEHDKIQIEAGKMDQATPSLEQLAGRDYTTRLGSYFGAGGQMDLGAGTGPFAKAAQDALYFKNKQMFDIEQGRATFDKNGALVGGEAFQDRKEQMRNENLLGAAGLDTPAMKFEAMKEHLSIIAGSILTLTHAAISSGIKLQDE